MSERSLGSSASVEKHMDQMETIAIAFVIPALDRSISGGKYPRRFPNFWHST